MARVRPTLDVSPQSTTPVGAVECFSSGAVLLDLVLGHGWPIGRIINIVGDRSSGKTLLAIEACANFARRFGVQRIRYAESEAAFDEAHASQLGLPNIQRTEENEIQTVEDFAEDILEFLKTNKNDEPCLYIIDSLDALSDTAEMDRALGEATYGTARAKLLSEFFRKHVGDLAKKRCTLMVISQIRDKIGVTFGETKTRSGGRALDFYSSIIVWLAERERKKQTIRGIDRTVGLVVEARTKKNKVAIPFRSADLTIRFGYGIDDEISMVEWLKKCKALSLMEHRDMPATEAELKKDIEDARRAGDRDVLNGIAKILQSVVTEYWRDIEHDLAPKMSKYGE